MQQSATQLLKHAQAWAYDTLNKRLTPYERLIVTNAALGKPTILPGKPDPRQDLNEPCPPKPGPNPLAIENQWTPDRTINPRLIRWLLEDPHNLVHHSGVIIFNARFEEQLDLESLITDRDLMLVRCRLDEGMYLRSAKILGICLKYCAVWKLVNAESCTMHGSLVLDGAFLNPAKGPALNLSLAKINGNASFRCDGSMRFQSSGTIYAPGVEVGGELSLNGALLEPSVGFALNLQGAAIAGSVNFRTVGENYFHALGAIHASRLMVSGQLNFNGSLLNPADGVALNLQDACVEGNAFFCAESAQRFRATGTIYAPRLKVRGQLAFNGAQLTPASGYALNLHNAIITSDAYFNPEGSIRFKAAGTIYAANIRVGGQLEFNAAFLNVTSSIALDLQGARISGNTLFRSAGKSRFHSNGTISAVGLSVGGQLEFDCALLRPSIGFAIDMQGASISGDAYFRSNMDLNFQANGPIDFNRAHFKGRLVFDSAQISSPAQCAIDLTEATIDGRATFSRYNSHMQPTIIVGSLDAKRAHFKSDLNMHGIHVSCPEARINAPEELGLSAAINLYSATIDGSLRLTPAPNGDQSVDTPKIIGPIDLRSAHVGRLADFVAQDIPKPPGPRSINGEGTVADFDGPLWRIDGLTYDRLGQDAARKAEHRLTWLDHDIEFRQNGKYQPQPFEQLISVLSLEGHVHAARTVAYERQIRLQKFEQGPQFQKAFYFFLWITIGYGYKLHRPVIGLTLLLILGTGIFTSAEFAGVVDPINPAAPSPPTADSLPFDLATLPDEHYQFDGFIYSLHTLMPNLGILPEVPWRINSSAALGKAVRTYEVLHIAMGWILTTLLAVGLTGALKKD